MAGSIIESMSSRKLGYILAFAMVSLITCFAIGGLISPTPNATMQYLATKCIDNSGGMDADTWFWTRGKGACERIDHFDDEVAVKRRLSADHIVFSFQMPLPRDSKYFLALIR